MQPADLLTDALRIPGGRRAEEAVVGAVAGFAPLVEFHVLGGVGAQGFGNQAEIGLLALGRQMRTVPPEVLVVAG